DEQAGLQNLTAKIRAHLGQSFTEFLAAAVGCLAARRLIKSNRHFADWRRNELGLSQVTVQRLIDVGRLVERNADIMLAPGLGVTVLYELAAPQADPAGIRAIIARAAGGERISVRAARAAVQRPRLSRGVGPAGQLAAACPA